jgi:hypothetical protein
MFSVDGYDVSPFLIQLTNQLQEAEPFSKS